MNKKIFALLLLLVFISDLFPSRLKKNFADNHLKPIEDLMAQRVVLLMEINRKIDIFSSESDKLFQKDYNNEEAGFLVKNYENYRHTHEPRKPNQQKNSLKVFGGNLYKKNEQYAYAKLFLIQKFDVNFHEVPRKILGVDVLSNGAKALHFFTAIDIDPILEMATNTVPDKISRSREHMIELETKQKLKSYFDEFILSNEMYSIGKKYISQEIVKLVNKLSTRYEYCKYSYSLNGNDCVKSNIVDKEDEFSILELETRYVRFEFDLNRIKTEREKYNTTWHLEEVINKLKEEQKVKQVNSPPEFKDAPYCIETTQDLTYSGKLCFNTIFDAKNKKFFDFGYFYPREFDFISKNEKLFKELLQNDKDLYKQMGVYVEYKIKEIEQKNIKHSDNVDIDEGI